MRDSKKSVDAKKKLLKIHYGKSRNQFEGFDDDRRVFCNVYDMLMEALDEMEHVNNNFVWVAFNDEFSVEMKTLERIQERFRDRMEEMDEDRGR